MQNKQTNKQTKKKASKVEEKGKEDKLKKKKKRRRRRRRRRRRKKCTRKRSLETQVRRIPAYRPVVLNGLDPVKLLLIEKIWINLARHPSNSCKHTRTQKERKTKENRPTFQRGQQGCVCVCVHVHVHVCR